MISTSRRRNTLSYIDSIEQDYITLSDLAEEIAAQENSKNIEELDSSERGRVYTGLYQGDLPKLDKHNIISYDQNRGIIREDIFFDPLNSYLSSNEDPSEKERKGLRNRIKSRF